ncbi:MAG: ATP-binding protein [Clostridia bacterium]|nr:ATP-binding protein [Clostridia bacterium]
MGFNSGIYREAFEQKKREQHNARLKYEKLRNELYSANPRLEELERELRSIGAASAMAAISGDENAVSEMQNRALALKTEKDALLGDLSLPSLQFDCAACEDSGYLPNGQICDCVKVIAKQIARKKLCEEMPIDDCRFDNFDLSYYPEKEQGSTTPRKRMTQILKVCREFADNFDSHRDNLLFLGGTGLGKTHLSLAIANEVLRGDRSVVYGSIQNLINKLSAETFSYSGSTDISDSILGCDLLIIDDLGTEMATSFSQSCIYNIINTRIMRGLSTVISTNLTLEELEKQYTARVASRILGSYTLLGFLGADIRQQKAVAAIKNR